MFSLGSQTLNSCSTTPIEAKIEAEELRDERLLDRDDTHCVTCIHSKNNSHGT